MPGLRLFSVGYQGRTLAELVRLLERADVDLVIDVRELPWSRKPGLSRRGLEAGLAKAGITYLHARFAGNPRGLRAKAKSYEEILRRYEGYLSRHPEIILELDSVFEEWKGRRGAICLLCYERHPADCHRSILLHHWRQATEDCSPVVHLDPDGAPRFTLRTLAGAGPSTPAAVGTTSR